MKGERVFETRSSFFPFHNPLMEVEILHAGNRRF